MKYEVLTVNILSIIGDPECVEEDPGEPRQHIQVDNRLVPGLGVADKAADASLLQPVAWGKHTYQSV